MSSSSIGLSNVFAKMLHREVAPITDRHKEEVKPQIKEECFSRSKSVPSDSRLRMFVDSFDKRQSIGSKFGMFPMYEEDRPDSDIGRRTGGERDNVRFYPLPEEPPPVVPDPLVRNITCQEIQLPPFAPTAEKLQEWHTRLVGKVITASLHSDERERQWLAEVLTATSVDDLVETDPRFHAVNY